MKVFFLGIFSLPCAIDKSVEFDHTVYVDAYKIGVLNRHKSQLRKRKLHVTCDLTFFFPSRKRGKWKPAYSANILYKKRTEKILSVRNSTIKYFHDISLHFSCSHSAGDVLMVQPSNLADVVQEFIAHLALEPEKKFFLQQNDPGETFPVSRMCWLPLSPPLDVVFPKRHYCILLCVIVLTVMVIHNIVIIHHQFSVIITQS